MGLDKLQTAWVGFPIEAGREAGKDRNGATQMELWSKWGPMMGVAQLASGCAAHRNRGGSGRAARYVLANNSTLSFHSLKA